MVNKPVLATSSVKAPAMVDKTEAEALAGAVFARPGHWFTRFRRGIAWATKVVTREEFDGACKAAVSLINGQPFNPEDAAKKAQRMVAAATDGSAHALCTKCDLTENAVITIYLGEPKAGFWFNRHILLKDPKGARRG